MQLRLWSPYKRQNNVNICLEQRKSNSKISAGSFLQNVWILCLNVTALQKATRWLSALCKGQRLLPSSFFAHLTVQNDDVGGKSLSIKCSLPLKTYLEKKRKKLLQYQIILDKTYASFSSCEFTQVELLVTRRRSNWQINTCLCQWERLRS